MLNALIVSNLILWILLLALIGVVAALARQIGVLHERIAPAGALVLNRGLKVGEQTPVVEVSDLDGHAHRVGGGPRVDRKSLLILFVSPACPVCKSILPIVKSSARAESAWLSVLLASDGDPVEHRRFVEQHGLREIPYVISEPLGLTYQAGRLPHAVLLDEEGFLRARGLINSREHLESLFEAKRLGVASIQDYFARKSQVA
jgi:methylamine dehydrogenase accessory protein MauD